MGNTLLIPFAKDEYLRFQWIQVLAKWSAHFIRPDTVFVGDSITASGRTFNNWRDINLGGSGLETHQIKSVLTVADHWHPHRISIMAGTNDASRAAIDAPSIRADWQEICTRENLVITLPPPTIDPAMNARLDEIRAIVRDACPGKPMIDLSFMADATGRIQTRYQADGIHLSPEGVSLWKQALAHAGI